MLKTIVGVHWRHEWNFNHCGSNLVHSWFIVDELWLDVDELWFVIDETRRKWFFKWLEAH